MGTTTTTTTSICLVLILIISIVVNHSAAQEPPPVLDIAGKPVRTGGKYYILPGIRGRGGGLTVYRAPGKNITCPASVVLAQNEVDSGLPVSFSPVNGPAQLVLESSSQILKFSSADVASACGGAAVTVLKLGVYDRATETLFTESGKMEGPASTSLFRILKSETGIPYSYKLANCLNKVTCRDLGIFTHTQPQDGTRRLALSLLPADDTRFQPSFPFFFKEAPA
ncbi:kunitz trypsin inhibitor 5-like [Andrographis paniculata]|uniref:kunitz trypsin inhibitor 5-like n=1 Tax=Andrographis paniculata TaxID=175694 RepID=UPI0021E96E42|nr:kunitz trypsin inhibitor 5-like [Andrographis paniculata]